MDPLKIFLDAGSLGLLALVLWRVGVLGERLVTEVSGSFRRLQDDVSEMNRLNAAHYSADDGYHKILDDRLDHIEQSQREARDLLRCICRAVGVEIQKHNKG